MNKLVLLKEKILFFQNKMRLKSKWRNNNLHNETTVTGYSDTSMIRVGRGTYGQIDHWCFGNPSEKLCIGNFVSIANDVKFLLGGNHQMITFSTFPLYSKLGMGGSLHDAQTKGPIIVEDEVWIGASAIILSGVRIGRGAIIAAGSVVSKDVKAFSIVGGNPALFIKMRFSDALVRKLDFVKLADFSDLLLKSNIDLFYQPLEESIDKIIKLKASIGACSKMQTEV